MRTIGIICEYNPVHLGHAYHIKQTKRLFEDGCAVVCVMSGNFVQRGDFAVFNKHARAEAAIQSGADLVLELPTPYVLLSAEGFADAGVYILDKLGICDGISFGSESGDLEALKEAARVTNSEKARDFLKKALAAGLPYAAAMQKAADEILGKKSEVFKSPNNVLGIEYLKAVERYGFGLEAVTMTRIGGAHDSGEGYCASNLRAVLKAGQKPWELMPAAAVPIFEREIASGRGPVFFENYEMLMLSRLRADFDYAKISGMSEGLERRFSRFARSEPSAYGILEKIKTKRYPMSRIRRILLSACLGITSDINAEPPPYTKVLAFNNTGAKLLKSAREKSRIQIITKPAEGKKLQGIAGEMFEKEVKATDFYSLAFKGEQRRGGSEWTSGPCLTL